MHAADKTQVKLYSCVNIYISAPDTALAAAGAPTATRVAGSYIHLTADAIQR